jgi:hypothetical protein
MKMSSAIWAGRQAGGYDPGLRRDDTVHWAVTRMIYLATFNWGWVLASGVVGLAMGWIAVVYRARAWSVVMLRKVAVLIAAAVLASVFHLFPGRVGSWLDLGLIMLAAYLVGCAIGSWLRHLVVSRHPPVAGA